MCDLPSRSRQVDSYTTKQLRSAVPFSLQTYQTSIKAPESHKRCVSFLLRNIGLRETGTVLSVRMLPLTLIHIMVLN